MSQKEEPQKGGNEIARCVAVVLIRICLVDNGNTFHTKPDNGLEGRRRREKRI